MKLKNKLIKYFILLHILVQGCFSIIFEDIAKDFISKFQERKSYNEENRFKIMMNQIEPLKVESEINLPLAMLSLYEDKIQNNYLEYVDKMQSTLSLIFSYNQEKFLNKIKDLIFEEIPSAEKGEDFYKPKILKIRDLVLDFCIGGYLKDFNNFDENPLLTLDPCVLTYEISQFDVLNYQNYNIVQNSKFLSEVFNESDFFQQLDKNSGMLKDTFKDKANIKEILLKSQSFLAEFKKNVLINVIVSKLNKFKDYGN